MGRQFRVEGPRNVRHRRNPPIPLGSRQAHGPHDADLHVVDPDHAELVALLLVLRPEASRAKLLDALHTPNN